MEHMFAAACVQEAACDLQVISKRAKMLSACAVVASRHEKVGMLFLNASLFHYHTQLFNSHTLSQVLVPAPVKLCFS